jgi:hypothetical protein
MIHGYKK